MKSKRNCSFLLPAIVLVVSALFIHSCEKTPSSAFSFEPTFNPEAGDTIIFTNESLDALSYEWDFGDGGSSSNQDPYYQYSESGSYDVTLTATNETKSALLTQSIQINDPTVLGILVYQDDEVTPLENCEVWVYDSEDNWNNDYFNPQFIGYTDSDGVVFFFNLEAQEYVVDIYLATATGYWGIAVLTPALELNANNFYNVFCTHYLDEAKKSLSKNREPGNLTPLL